MPLVTPLPIPDNVRPELMQWSEVERLSYVLTEEGPSILKAVTSPASLQTMDPNTIVKLVQQVRTRRPSVLNSLKPALPRPARPAPQRGPAATGGSGGCGRGRWRAPRGVPAEMLRDVTE
eukprot:1193653-Prorocentrum_minimum.AAC.9